MSAPSLIRERLVRWWRVADGRRPGRVRSGVTLSARRMFRARGDACRIDFRSRRNSGNSRLTLLALSIVVALLPWANAWPSCHAPVDPFANPFDKESAHHRPIGSGAVFADDAHPSTISLLKGSFNNINSDNGYGINVYESTSDDPLLTVAGSGPGVGLPVELHVPRNANNGETTDSTVVIRDMTSGATHEFYYWRWNDGKPTAHIHREWDIKGPGHGQPGGARVGVSASGVALMFGLLRGDEINTPGRAIEHALQISLSYKGKCGNQVRNEAVWPATSTDRYCKTDPALCSGDIPYGALLALPPSVDIAGLGLSEPGRRVATALQNYGAYVVDTTGCPNMRGDQNIDAAVKRAVIDDMRKVYPLLRMVLNNSAGQTASGGGSPRAENCSFDSPDR
jgi:hypothetical protein